MAGRILNRRELRKQADLAEQTPEIAPAAAVAAPSKKRVRTEAPASGAKKRVRKKAVPSLRARWGIFDGGMKQVAIFDYNQRPAAEEKLAALLAKGKGPYFLQIVKEPMPEPDAGVLVE
jgi:hypothetical protein